jgi:O-antigen ligase
MTYILGLLILALLLKDAAPIGDTYVLRGLSEGLALIVGAYWFLTHSRLEIYKKYILIFGYLIALSLTIPFSSQPIYVGFQVISLAAVLLFFIAHLEASPNDAAKNETVMNVTMMAFIIVCLASLVLLVYSPGFAYEETLEGRRFKGLFGKPAKMAATSGLLLGLCIFSERKVLLRATGILSSLPCLYLTGSRTFWAAGAASLLITAIFYLRRKLEWGLAAVMIISFSLIVTTVADINISSKARSRILRIDSLERMSGRTVIWGLAFEKFWDRPLLGYGFTLGSDAFKEGEIPQSPRPNSPTLLNNETFTLHSGYVQALLDSGFLGASLYLSIVMSVLWRLIKYDTGRKYGAEMYCAGFLTISNFGESVILSAAVFHAVFYWYLATFALSLDRFHESTQETFAAETETTKTSKAVSKKRKYELLKTI